MSSTLGHSSAAPGAALAPLVPPAAALPGAVQRAEAAALQLRLRPSRERGAAGRRNWVTQNLGGSFAQEQKNFTFTLECSVVILGGDREGN